MLRLRRATGRAGVFACLLGLAATLPLDAAVHDLAFRYVVSHDVRLVANGFTMLGTAWAAAGVLGGLAVVARYTGDTPLLRASLGGLAGIAAGSLAIQVVKQAACRARPRLVDGWGVDAGGPLDSALALPDGSGFFHWPCFADGRYQSFPSGHATVAFAVAAALTAAARSRRGVWLAVAAGVALSRVLLNAHFLSDVVGGGLIGWWAGQLGVRLATRVAPVPSPVPPVAAGPEPDREAGAPTV